MLTKYQLLTLISNKFQISDDIQEEIYKIILKNIQKQIIGDDYSGSGIYKFYREMTDADIYNKYQIVRHIKNSNWIYAPPHPNLKHYNEYQEMVSKNLILSLEDHELLYPSKIDEKNVLLGNTAGFIREMNINGIKITIQHSERLGSLKNCIITMPKHTKKELCDKLDKEGIPYKKNLKKKYLYELLGIPQTWSENQ